MLPPQFAVWIPPGISHSVTSAQAIDYCSLFVDRVACEALSAQSRLLHLTPFLQELTRAAAEDRHAVIEGGRERLNAVILDQLQLLEPAQLALPMPSSTRLYPLVEYYLANPGDMLQSSHWADKLSMSERTLVRLFRREVAMSPLQWLHRLRVLRAIELIKAGESVTTIALDLGYNQASAFIAMFRKITVRTPSSYMQQHDFH